MARRRMFSLDVVDTDKFACMSKDARYLYYELGVRADDDGFIGSPRRIIKMTESTMDDLNELINNGFIIRFNTGIVVIKDWLQNNQIRSDRYKPTIYSDEKQQISIDECTKKYIFTGTVNPMITNGLPSDIPDGNQMTTNGLLDKSNDIQKEPKNKVFGKPKGNQRFPQDRLGKDSIGKDSIGKDSINNNCVNSDHQQEYFNMFKSNVGNEQGSNHGCTFTDIVEMYNEICQSFEHIDNPENYTEMHSSIFINCFHKGYTEKDYRNAFNNAENSDYLKENKELSWILENLDMVKRGEYK